MQLSAVTSLTKMLKTASSLPTFTPSHGHSYLPPAPKADSQAGAQAQPTTKEDTPMPEAEAQQAKGPSGASQAGSTGAMVQDARTLAESFSLLSRYGDEYMDETPLVGEPGSFILSRSGDADRGPAKQQQQQQRPGASNVASPTRAGTPLVRVDTPGKSSKVSTPSSTDETRSKRKKSRAG